MDMELFMALDNFSIGIEKIDANMQISSEKSLIELTELNQNILNLQNSITSNLSKIGLISEQIQTLSTLRNQTSLQENQSMDILNESLSIKSIVVSNPEEVVESPNVGIPSLDRLNLEFNLMMDKEELNLPKIEDMMVSINYDIPDKPNLETQFLSPVTIPLEYGSLPDIVTSIPTIDIPLKLQELPPISTFEITPKIKIEDIESSRIVTNSIETISPLEKVIIPIEYENLKPEINSLNLKVNYDISEFPITDIRIPVMYDTIEKIDMSVFEPVLLDLKYSQFPDLDLSNVELPKISIPLDSTQPELPNFDIPNQTINFDITEPDFTNMKSYEIKLDYILPDIVMDDIVIPTKLSTPEKPNLEPIVQPITLSEIPMMDSFQPNELKIPVSFMDLPKFNLPNFKDLSLESKVTEINENITQTTDFSSLMGDIDKNLSTFNGKLMEFNNAELITKTNIRFDSFEIGLENIGSKFLNIVNSVNDVISNRLSLSNVSEPTRVESNLGEPTRVESTMDVTLDMESRPETLLNTKVEFEKISNINNDISNKTLMSIDPDQFKSLMSSMETNSNINVSRVGGNENIGENVNTKTISLTSDKSSSESSTPNNTEMIDVLSSLDEKMSLMVGLLSSMKTWFDDNQNMNNSSIRNYKHL